MDSVTNRYVIEIDAVWPDRLTDVGGKGASLATLSKNGFRIPKTIYVTAEIPDNVRHSLTAGIEKSIGSKPAAVRSSADSEDTEGSSFAGLHESFLNIRGVGAILEHIKKVWASLWTGAAVSRQR